MWCGVMWNLLSHTLQIALPCHRNVLVLIGRFRKCRHALIPDSKIVIFQLLHHKQTRGITVQSVKLLSV